LTCLRELSGGNFGGTVDALLTGGLAGREGVADAERMEAEIWSVWKGDHSFLEDSATLTIGEAVAVGAVVGGSGWLIELEVADREAGV
jgi:hypothetical protein